MSAETALAASYRVKAEELRTIADEERMAETRKALIRIARDYDQMADSLEAIERTNRSLLRG